MSVWEWLFGKGCEHDWVDKETAERFIMVPDCKGGERKAHKGMIYVKECKKCHRIWAQKVEP